MEIFDNRKDDRIFTFGAHFSCVNDLLVDIVLDGRILLTSVPLNHGWDKFDTKLMSAIPKHLSDSIAKWRVSADSLISEDLFGANVCGDEVFTLTYRYCARNKDEKSDVVIAAYWLGEAGSVFVDVRYVILQCDGGISTESNLNCSWNSLKIVPLIPMDQQDAYLEPPNALPI